MPSERVDGTSSRVATIHFYKIVKTSGGFISQVQTIPFDSQVQQIQIDLPKPIQDVEVFQQSKRAIEAETKAEEDGRGYEGDREVHRVLCEVLNVVCDGG